MAYPTRQCVICLETKSLAAFYWRTDMCDTCFRLSKRREEDRQYALRQVQEAARLEQAAFEAHLKHLESTPPNPENEILPMRNHANASGTKVSNGSRSLPWG